MDAAPSPARVKALRASLLADTEILDAHLRSPDARALPFELVLQIRSVVTQNRFLISRLGSAYAILLTGRSLTEEQVSEIERIAEYIRKNREPEMSKEEQKGDTVGVDVGVKVGGQEGVDIQDKQNNKEEEEREEEEEEEGKDNNEPPDDFTSPSTIAPSPPPSLPLPVATKTPVFHSSKTVHFESPLPLLPSSQQLQHPPPETHQDGTKTDGGIPARGSVRRDLMMEVEVVNSDKEEQPSPAIEIDMGEDQQSSRASSRDLCISSPGEGALARAAATEDGVERRRAKRHQHSSRVQRRGATQTRTLYCLSCRLMMQQEEILALRLVLGRSREETGILACSTDKALSAIRDPLPKYLDTLRQLKSGVADALSSVAMLCSASHPAIPREEQHPSPSQPASEPTSRRVSAEDRAVARSVARTRELLRSLESTPPHAPTPQLPPPIPPQTSQGLVSGAAAIPSTSSTSTQQTSPPHSLAAAPQQTAETSASASLDSDRAGEQQYPRRDGRQTGRGRASYLQQFLRTASPVAGCQQLPGGVVKAPRIRGRQ